MEEELKQLQNEVDELRKGFTKSKELIDERINNRMEDLEKENRDIYSDQEIANLNMGLQRIEKEVNKKLEKLLSQIEEINEFENGKKEKIDELNKKINEKIDKLTEQGYSYSDVYLDEEIQNLQAEIESIKKEKIVTKAELNEARNDYQGLKTEKQKLENEIKEIEKTDNSEHLLEEKKQLENEIRSLKSKGKDDNDPEIKEYLSDIAKIDEELKNEKNKVKSKEKKDKLEKILKAMGTLEEKYGKDKLDEPQKQEEKKETTKKDSAGQNQESAQTNPSTTQTTGQQGKGSAQTNPGVIQTIKNPVPESKKEYIIEFNKYGIFCDGTLTDISQIKNLHELVENAKNLNPDVKLKFDLRGMSLISRALKNCALSRDQVKQIKDFAYENRGNASIIHGLLTKQGFMIRDMINKIKQQPLFTKKKEKEVLQIPEKAESLQNSNRQNLMQQLDARDYVAATTSAEKSQQNDSKQASVGDNFDLPLESDASKDDDYSK